MNEEKNKYFTYKCALALLVMSVPFGFGFVWGIKLFSQPKNSVGRCGV